MSNKFAIRPFASARPQNSWELAGSLDATAGAADATLGVAERDFTSANALDNTASIEIGADAANIMLRCYSTTNDADAVFDVWAMRNGDTDMRRVCTITAKTGNQDYGTSYKFADTLTITNGTTWPTTPVTYTAADTMGVTVLPTYGFETFLFHAYGTCDEDYSIEVAGY